MFSLRSSATRVSTRGYGRDPAAPDLAIVEQFEDLLDASRGSFYVPHLAGHHLEELGEIDGAVAMHRRQCEALTKRVDTQRESQRGHNNSGSRTTR
jgi:hypothetical protein